MYVIGGLVDRSVQKTSSLSRAADLGVQTARYYLVRGRVRVRVRVRVGEIIDESRLSQARPGQAVS